LRNIYLIQAGELFSEGESKSAYFPYAAGTLAAYAWDDEIIRNEYALKRFVFYREEISVVVGSIENPFLVGFSNYIWNFAYNKALAGEIKKLYPDCIIVFGGHQVPPGTSLLEECGYIDYLVHGEGEVSFKKLLLELIEKNDFSQIPNLSYRADRPAYVSNPLIYNKSIDFPSPYLSGTFDSLLADNDIKFIAILETNRGCPYKCAYCSCRANENEYALKMIPTERVFNEIVWFAQNKIEYCLCADSNFGICGRDESIVDHIIDTKIKTGYPIIFSTAYAKEKDKSIFKIVGKLSKAGMLKEFTLSFQSLSADVIRNIGRVNMSTDNLSRLMKTYGKAGIYPYTELILGLPGETYESFRNGFETLIEAGQQYYVHVWPCFVLENSPMSKKEYLSHFGIKTIHSPWKLNHSEPDISSGPSGYSNIIISTKTMSEEMWIRSNLFAVYIQSLYFMGVLKQVSTYLFHEYKVKYVDLFENFIEWSANHSETICGRIYTAVYDVYYKFTKGEGMLSYFNSIFGDTTWGIEEGVFLETVTHFDDFFHEMELFLSSYQIPDDILTSLLLFQKNMINIPCRNHVNVCLTHDFHDFFSKLTENKYQPLIKKQNTLTVSGFKSYCDRIDYAREIVWYGRKIGRTYYSDRNSVVSVEYPGDCV
jgi:radical SAM superfamily enzyme YgiQ (UPF0313 family)